MYPYQEQSSQTTVLPKVNIVEAFQIREPMIERHVFMSWTTHGNYGAPKINVGEASRMFILPYVYT